MKNIPKWQMDFYRAVCPEYTELAVCMHDEKGWLIMATQKIADQQILIEQFVTIIEKSKTDPEARAFGWLYIDINELNAALAAAKDII